MPRNIDKKLNVKDKDMCYFCRERERGREREREGEREREREREGFTENTEIQKILKAKVRSIFGVITIHRI